MLYINKNTTHKKDTLPEVIVDRIMIDATELATRAQEGRIAVSRYVAKYLEKAFCTETEPVALQRRIGSSSPISPVVV